MSIGYYFITDACLSRAGNESDVMSAAAAGVKIVQYREKCAGTRAMCDEAMRLKRAAKGALFLINDRVDVALAVDADGVHLGQDDMAYKTARRLLGGNKMIGVTVHDLRQAIDAEKMGADYVGLAPIFSTGTKKDAGKPCGVKLIEKIKKELSIPIVAIGGIDLANAEEVIAAGADGICAISAVVTKRDVRSTIKKFQRMFC